MWGPQRRALAKMSGPFGGAATGTQARAQSSVNFRVFLHDPKSGETFLNGFVHCRPCSPSHQAPRCMRDVQKVFYFATYKPTVRIFARYLTYRIL